MATLRAAANNAGTGVASIAASKPVGVVDGDVMLMVVDIVAGTVSTPAGWTLILGPTTSSIIQYVFWKVAASEPASWTVTITGGPSDVGVITIAFSGLAATQPASDHVGQQGNATSTSITSPALAWTGAETGVAVGLYGTGGSLAITPPAGYTEPTNGDLSWNLKETEVAYQMFSAVTSVASTSATGGSSKNVGAMVFLKDAATRLPSRVTLAQAVMRSAVR